MNIEELKAKMEDSYTREESDHCENEVEELKAKKRYWKRKLEDAENKVFV